MTITLSDMKAILARTEAQAQRVKGNFYLADLLDSLACEINRLEAQGQYPLTT